MNTYKKYCPNVFIAQCDDKHEKGDVILVTTKNGKENECIVHNFIGYAGTKEKPLYCYSVTRTDGYDCQARAKAKAEKLNLFAESATRRSEEYYAKADLSEEKTGIPFGQPILIGHHSERGHRKTIERADNAMRKSIEENKKAEDYERRSEYWEQMANVINLSMPESMEYYKSQLKEAEEYHKGLKDGTIKKEHDYSLVYASKRIKELKSKYEIALKLWA